MQRIFAQPQRADSLLQAAPETQYYRNEEEIKKLFRRLAIPIKQLQVLSNCYLLETGPFQGQQ